MKLDKVQRRFEGGRGPKYVAKTEVPSGRAVPAPRIPPPAAAACRRAMDAFSSSLGMDWGPMLHIAFTKDRTWVRLLAAMRNEGTTVQYEQAAATLRHNRGRYCFANESQQELIVSNLQRVIRRRAADCITFKGLGITTVPPLYEGVAGLLDHQPVGKVRPTPPAAQQEGPLQYSTLWQLDRIAKQGVIVFGRAGDRVRKWRKDKAPSAGAAPPLALAESLVHEDLLPTATASRPDQWWLTEQQRYMSVREVCRAFGVGTGCPLAAALQRVDCPTNAVSMLGKAIHAGVASRILRMLADMKVLPDKITYASACSGIDTFASAVNAMFGAANWQYMHAAEKDLGPRAVLADAWGLDPQHIYSDAASTQAVTAPTVDLFVLSPDCNKFSARNRGRNTATPGALQAAGAADATAVMGFVFAARARIVVVENVNDPDGAAMLRSSLSRAKAYFWRSQMLDPPQHAGVPAKRERRFFVGILRQFAPQWA